MGTQFTSAYAEIVAGLASPDFAGDKDWQALVIRGRKLAGVDGFECGEASLVDDLRKKLSKADRAGTNEAVSLLGGAGIEEEFFGTRNTLTGLQNWARIVIHELTHRELKTADHAYEHQGINPKKLTAAKAIENADSWAWFCADCAGALTASVITNALER
jgi:hypothetical protein